MDIKLLALTSDDREQFILDNQEAFNYGALEEFGRRDDHFEESGEIISRKTIERCIDGGEAYRICLKGKKVGGLILKVDGHHGELEILFVTPKAHGHGIGQAAWRAVERLHPEVEVWETLTPYFETRNIHFYVNCCGFHIVEFFNRHHAGPAGCPPEEAVTDEQFPDGMFRFEKRIPNCNYMGNSKLLDNIEKLHTTALGAERIRRNLGLGDVDVVEWCRSRILDKDAVIGRQGKNWQVRTTDCFIPVNASSHTIITAHR